MSMAAAISGDDAKVFHWSEDPRAIICMTLDGVASDEPRFACASDVGRPACARPPGTLAAAPAALAGTWYKRFVSASLAVGPERGKRCTRVRMDPVDDDGLDAVVDWVDAQGL